VLDAKTIWRMNDEIRGHCVEARPVDPIHRRRSRHGYSPGERSSPQGATDAHFLRFAVVEYGREERLTKATRLRSRLPTGPKGNVG
jgi:hypothetical protein